MNIQSSIDARNPGFHVRKVELVEIEAAFGVLRDVAQWLLSKGRRQRISKTTWDTYMRWQGDGVNYLVENEGSIAGVFSLPREPLSDWPMLEIVEPVVWLRALATNPSHRNQRVGEFAVASSIDLVCKNETLYLDCVSDFLPDYYQSLGFELVARQTRDYPDERQPLDISLLRFGKIR